MISSEFLLTSLIVVLLPGTGVLYTISNGLFLGKKESIAATIGCTFGVIPHLLASILGLATLLHTSAVAFSIVKFMGVAYLLYLAWGMYKNSTGVSLDDNVKSASLHSIAIKGFLINILNPKLSLFFLAFIPQFISTNAISAVNEMLVLSFIFMIMTFIVFAIYGIFAHKLRVYIVDSPKIMQRIQQSFSAIFVFLGVKLAFAEK